MKILQISSSIALALMLSNNVFGQKVEHVGQQKTVGQNADPHIKLDTLTITKNFEGMGPVDRVNGEITVLDGKIYAAIIKNNALAIRHDNNLTAPFFVWAQASLPAGGYATPSTYAVNGRQFVVIACGGGKLGTKSGDAYVAFALPRE